MFIRKRIATALVLMATLVALHGNESASPWFLDHVHRLSSQVERYAANPPSDAAAQIEVLAALGDALLVMRDYDAAIKQYEAALDIQQKLFQNLDGEDIVPGLIQRIALRTRVGNALLDAGQNMRARRILEQTLALASWGVDGSHEVVRDLRTAHSLALVFTLRLEEADTLYAQLYEAARNAYPPDHPVLARIMTRWAIVDVSLERYAEAIDRVQQSLEIEKSSLGPEHPSVADRYAMLASLHYAHGDRALVEGFLTQVHKIRLAAFGEPHPLTQEALENQRKFAANDTAL